jgi:hypothetical protein
LADGIVEYTPKAYPLGDDSLFWKKLRDEGLASKMAGQWLELDLYDYTETVVESLMNNFVAQRAGLAFKTLRRIAISGKPAQSLALLQ